MKSPREYTGDDITSLVFAQLEARNALWLRALAIAFAALTNQSPQNADLQVSLFFTLLRTNPSWVRIQDFYGLQTDEPQADVFINLGSVTARILFAHDEDGWEPCVSSGLTPARDKARRKRRKYEAYLASRQEIKVPA